MNWDEASLSKEPARSHCRDNWHDFEWGQSGTDFRELPVSATIRDPAAPTDPLRKFPRQPNETNDGEMWAPATVVSLSTEYRLIPGYRSGDRKIASGRDLFSVGQPGKAIFNLLDGWVAIYTLLEDGRRQIVHFALPGAVLGVLPSKGAQSTFGAQALTHIVVSVIPNATLTKLVQDEPEISMRLTRSLARDCSMAYEHITSIGRRSARERVAHLLLELFVRCRAQWPGNRIEEMTIPLTQEQIGDATGLTFVHVNRVLSTLRKDRIVEFHYRRLRILDPDRLIDVAGVDPQSAMSWIER